MPVFALFLHLLLAERLLLLVQLIALFVNGHFDSLIDLRQLLDLIGNSLQLLLTVSKHPLESLDLRPEHALLAQGIVHLLLDNGHATRQLRQHAALLF